MDPQASHDQNQEFLRFARERWLLSPQEAERCLKRCLETGRPAAEVAQELKLLSSSVAMIVGGLASETRDPSDERGTQVTSAVAEPSPASVTDKGALARYEIRGELGRGAMAVVYEAHDTQMDRDVALKILVEALGASQDGPRFQREVQAIAGMGRHPNIVNVYDFGADGGIFYYTMERVDGEPLDEWLGLQPRSLREIVEVVAGVARGLAHAHDHGIIHRDVKPENVLVTGDGKPLVSDFGLARSQEVDSHLTAAGMVLGTPAYMSPEQALGQTSDLTPATDVYGLGVVLYEAITGQLPVEREGIVEMLIEKLQKDPPPPSSLRPDLPASLEAIILKSLARQVEQRYPDAHALEGALSDWLASGSPAPLAPPLPAPPALSAPVPVARPGKLVSGPTLVTAATVCVFALMGLMAVLADRRQGEPKGQAALTPASPASGADVAVQVVIGEPEPEHLTANGEVSVSGRVTAGNAEEVWVDGQQVEVRQGAFWVELSLEDGSHTLVVSLEPEGEPLATFTLHVDTTAPLISVDTPGDGDVLNVELLPIQGSVTDRYPETLQLADGPHVEVAEDGAFDLVYDLPDQDGEVTVELIARDRAGNVTRHPIRVVVDRSPPRIVLSHGASLVARVGAEATLQGRVDDAHPAVLYVDGQARDLEADGSFSVSREVTSEGTWEVLLQAEDGVGHRSPEQTVSIVGDGTPPRLEVEAPLENLVTRESEVPVRGRVTDAHGIAGLTVQGQGIALAPDGAFSTSVPVAEGETRVEVVAKDAAGNRVTLVRLVSQDTSPPAITLEPEPAVDHYGRSRIEITGHMDEPGCTLTLNGKPVEVEAGRFSAIARLVVGENTLVLEATDRAGNVTRQEWVVHYTRRKPKLPRDTWWNPTREQLAYAGETGLPLWFKNKLGMRFVLIPPGTFLMGSPEDEKFAEPWKEKQHRVLLTRGFYMAATEVTNDQGIQFRKRPSVAKKGFSLDEGAQPLVNLTWEEARESCDWLNENDPVEGRYRLPTEAEWEYACRAGTTTAWYWGDDMAPSPDYANVCEAATRDLFWEDAWKGKGKELAYPYFPNDDGFRVAAPVATFKPNAWGLYDMIGNVSEWCSDWFNKNWYALVEDERVDPDGPPKPKSRDGQFKVLRGGSWMRSVLTSRAGGRRYLSQDWHEYDLGIRLVVEPAPRSKR